MRSNTRFINRRLVRAWQVKRVAGWIAPGQQNPNVMPEGTWVVESVSDGHRWAVQPHLFWGKYKLVRRKTAFNSVYLNIEQVRFEDPDNRGHLVTEEGTQQLGRDDLIAVGDRGDRWPVPATRVGTAYRIDTPLNRLRLLFAPDRGIHVLGRTCGFLLLTISCFLLMVSAQILLSEQSDPIPFHRPGLVRVLSTVVLLLPVVSWIGLRLFIPSLLRPSFLSALVLTVGWLLVCWYILGLGTGLDVYDAALESIRIFTVSALPEALNGQLRTFALTGQLAATTISFLAFAAVGRALLRRSWDNLVTWLGSFDVVIWGLGATGMRVIEELRSDVQLYDAAQRVVVVDKDSDNPRIRRVQDLGVPVLIDRGNTTQLLRRLATSPFRLRWTADRILALTNDMATNLRVAEAVNTRKAKQKAVAVMIRVDSLWSEERMRSRPVSSERTMHTLTVSAYSSCAEKVRVYLRRSSASVKAPQPLVIIGFSQVAVALIDSLRTESILRRSYVDAVSRIRIPIPISHQLWGSVIWVTEPGSKHVARTLLPADVELSGGRERGPVALQVDVHETMAPFECDIGALLGEGIEPQAVVLCGPDAQRAITRFYQPGRDEERARGRIRVLFVETDPGNQAAVDTDDVGDTGALRGPVPLVVSDGLRRPGSYFDGEVGVIAGVVHEFFRTTKDRSREQKADPANQEWTSPWLAADKRQDTFLWVQNALNWLHEDHHLVVRQVRAEHVPSTPDGWTAIAERMAQREHEDWCRRNRRDQPWETLPQREKERNRLPFLYLPDLLSGCRLELRPA